MEESLQTNFTKLVLESVPTPIAILDKNHNYVYANQSWMKQFNIEKFRPEMRMRESQAEREEWDKVINRVLEGEIIKNDSYFLPDFQGKTAWFKWEARPLYTDKNEIGGVIMVCENITELKESEAARKIEEKKFHAIVDQASIGITQIDTEGHYLLVNNRFKEMLGYTDEELRQKKFQDITHPEDLERDHKYRRRAIEGKNFKPFDYEKRYIRKDGTVIWVHLSVSVVVDETGENVKYFIATAQDISKRKNIETQLLNSEQKFKTIFEQTALGMAQVSLAGKIIYANRKCCEILGYPLEELQHLHFVEFTHPEDVEKDVSNLEKLIKEEIYTYTIEKRYIRKDKSITWANLTVTMLKDINNEPQYFIAALEDITLRKKNEEELEHIRLDLDKKVRERTSYLELLQKISSIANESENINEALTKSLDEICDLTKWQIGHFSPVKNIDIPHLKIEDIWFLEDEKKYKNFVNFTREMDSKPDTILHKVIVSGKPYWANDIFAGNNFLRCEVGIKAEIKSGMAFPVLVGNVVVGVLEFFSNFNIHPSPALMELMSQIGVQLGRLLERQQAQEQIKFTQARLQAIIDNIPARIFLKDLKGRYLIVNKVFEEFFGMKKESFIGKTAYDIFGKQLANKWTYQDDVVIKEGKIVSYEVDLNQDNYKKTLLLTKFPVPDLYNKIYGFGGLSFDVTEEKKNKIKMQELLESEHNARTEAERAIMEREEFISIASHELKSPITVLKMKAQLLNRQLTKDENSVDPCKMKQFINKLEKDVDRLVLLINRLLDLTRIRSGRLDLNRENVNITDLITNIIDSHSIDSEGNFHEIKFNQYTGIHGFWDRSRIEQVIVNLLTNAIKFGENKPILISTEKDHDIVRVKVKDQGIGITQENINKIFERFERGSAQKKIQGLGLGLYIVKQIVEAHGGTIKVESTLGNGSTFIVELPTRPTVHLHDKERFTTPGHLLH